MKVPVVFCLHGFLGQPSDWQFLIEESADIYEFVFVDYNNEPTLDPTQPLAIWGKKFNQWVMQFGEDRPRHLIGYSLGGRLALHALQDQIQLWSKAVLISTHTGLTENSHKEARLKSDTLFAEKIEKGKWSQILYDWNKQFNDQQKEPDRSEISFQRKILSTTLKSWSLGFQYDFRETIPSWQVEQLWLAGEKDNKYRNILEEIPLSHTVQKGIVPASSHRIPFEQPDWLRTRILHFLN